MSRDNDQKMKPGISGPKAFLMMLIMLVLTVLGVHGGGLDSLIKGWSPLSSVQKERQKGYEYQETLLAELQQEAVQLNQFRSELTDVIKLSQSPLPAVKPAPNKADYKDNFGGSWRYDEAMDAHRTSAKAYNNEVISRKAVAEDYFENVQHFNKQVTAFYEKAEGLDASHTKLFKESVQPISILATRPYDVVRMSNCEVPVVPTATKKVATDE